MKKLHRSLSLFFVIVMLSCLCFVPAHAAGTAQISIRTAMASEGQYLDCTAFSAGDKLYVPVKFNGISDTYVQGFRASVTYDDSALLFLKESFTAVEDESAEFYTRARDGKVTMTWDTQSESTAFNGEVFFLVFLVKEDISAKTVTFKLTVADFYATGSGDPDIPYNLAVSTASAQIAPQNVPQDVLALLRRLETITLDSLDDIVAAETAWNALTDKQKVALGNKYPQEYDWLSTARTRYNQEVEYANAEQILQLVEKFKKDYADVLALTEDTVTIENEDRVSKAKIAYEALPPAVTSRLDKAIPGLLEKLLERISALRDAINEAKDFQDTYGYLTEITDVMLESGFGKYSVLIDEAVMVSEMLSAEAQKLAEKEIIILKELKDKCDAIVARDAEQAKIREEINAFQQKWLYVFTLNPGNVTVYDQSAINMVLSDYNKLSKAAQKGLESRMRTVKGLLDIIRELEANTDEVPEIPEIPEIPQTPETPQDPPAGNPDSNGNPPSAEKVTVTQFKYLNKGVSLPIKILLLLLLLAVLTLLIPFAMMLRYKQRCKLLAPQPAMDDIYSSEERRPSNE